MSRFNRKEFEQRKISTAKKIKKQNKEGKIPDYGSRYIIIDEFMKDPRQVDYDERIETVDSEAELTDVRKVMEYGLLTAKRKQLYFDLNANRLPNHEVLRMSRELVDVEEKIKRMQTNK